MTERTPYNEKEHIREQFRNILFNLATTRSLILKVTARQRMINERFYHIPEQSTKELFNAILGDIRLCHHEIKKSFSELSRMIKNIQYDLEANSGCFPLIKTFFPFFQVILAINAMSERTADVRAKQALLPITELTKACFSKIEKSIQTNPKPFADIKELGEVFSMLDQIAITVTIALDKV